MTGPTIDTELPVVLVVLLVAGVTILQGHLEIAEAARVEMALLARKIHMPAGELERKRIVVEALVEAVHAVMAVEAGRAKGGHVDIHERHIDLAVAGITRFQCKCGDIIAMTVTTLEWFARRRSLMSDQRETQPLVREGR